MNPVYIDTNIFIYLSDQNSEYYQQCISFIEILIDQQLDLVTSTETIQEIIHFSKNTKQLPQGLKIAKSVLENCASILPFSLKTIEIYLSVAAIYPSSRSRDLIHLSSCTEYGLDCIITYDHGFKRFSSVQSLTPQEFISKIQS